MSIAKMVAAHPQVAGNDNEALLLAARHAMFCAVICTSCADACSAEDGDMQQCIRFCSDCADVCTATARLAVRRTAQNVDVLRQMLETCIAACEACATECERHDNDHCARCAEMCRETAGDIRKAMPSVE